MERDFPSLPRYGAGKNQPSPRFCGFSLQARRLPEEKDPRRRHEGQTVRRFGRELVEVFFPKEKIESLRFLQSSPKRELLFWLVFVVPGTPKDLLCYFAGLTDLSWGKWLLICSLGRVPSIITSTVGGNALGGKNYLFAILVFAGTLAVSAIGLLIYRGLCRRHEKKQNGKT